MSNELITGQSLKEKEFMNQIVKKNRERVRKPRIYQESELKLK